MIEQKQERRIHVRVDEDVYVALAEEDAKRRGRKTALIVNEALRAYLLGDVQCLLPEDLSNTLLLWANTRGVSIKEQIIEDLYEVYQDMIKERENNG